MSKFMDLKGTFQITIHYTAHRLISEYVPFLLAGNCLGLSGTLTYALRPSSIVTYATQ